MKQQQHLLSVASEGTNWCYYFPSLADNKTSIMLATSRE